MVMGERRIGYSVPAALFVLAGSYGIHGDEEIVQAPRPGKSHGQRRSEDAVPLVSAIMDAKCQMRPCQTTR